MVYERSSREFAFAVQRDLSVLERALKSVNPSIAVESAPIAMPSC